MNQIALLSDARSELWLPSLSLSACIRGVMLRDTRGVMLGPEQRYSHYPATLLCSISWYLDGQVDLLEAGYAAATPMHRVTRWQHAWCSVAHKLSPPSPGAMDLLMG